MPLSLAQTFSKDMATGLQPGIDIMSSKHHVKGQTIKTHV